MKTVSPDYAAGHLAELLDEVAAGAEILIVADGDPVARLLPPARARSVEDEDPEAPSDEVEQAFHGD